MLIDVAFTPHELKGRDLSGRLVIAIDVLRATTTGITALHHGARAVRPVLEPEAARAEAVGLEPGTFILGGERLGLAIPGFHLGNSPSEYASDTTRGKTVILTTTNGTRLLVACRQAAEVLMGALVNATAVARLAAQIARPVVIACAGQDGALSREDALCAGLLVSLLTRPELTLQVGLTDNAAVAYGLFAQEAERLPAAVAETPHARYLAGIGLGEDVEYCTRVDALPAVPRRSNRNLKEWTL